MNRLKQLRKEHHLTQAELAKKLNVQPAAISKYETGENGFPISTLKRLVAIFGVSSDYILGFSGSPVSSETVNPADYAPVPLLGRVAGGTPIPAIEDWCGEVEYVQQTLIRPDEPLYALRIRGNSMYPKIMDGDVVIVRQQRDVDNGQIAIVLVDGEDATCKKVRKEENGITLIGFNTDIYEPHFYSHADLEKMPVQIIGLVLEIRRRVV